MQENRLEKAIAIADSLKESANQIKGLISEYPSNRKRAFRKVYGKERLNRLIRKQVTAKIAIRAVCECIRIHTIMSQAVPKFKPGACIQ